MKSVERSSSGPGDRPRNRECYRCDRPAAPPFLFRIEVEAPDVLSRKYGDSVRYCCEHCAAAMNLSEFSEQMKESAGRR